MIYINEVDLIIERADKKIPVEIKATETINTRFFTVPAWFAKETKASHKPIIIYSGQHTQKREQGSVIPWIETDSLVDLLK